MRQDHTMASCRNSTIISHLLFTKTNHDSSQTPAPKTSFFGWLGDFRQLSDEHILQHASLDGYFFVRYLKMLTIISFVGVCVTWPVLFPVNATGGGGQKQLDILSMSNIANPNRYYAQALIAWLFLGRSEVQLTTFADKIQDSSSLLLSENRSISLVSVRPSS